MRSPYTQLFVHLVWATWDRLPLVTGEIRAKVFDCVQAECGRLRGDLIAVGGVEDHVHVLARMPTTVAVADFVKRLKGTSSHLINHEVAKGFGFRWQGAYGAFSVSRTAVPRVRDYIHRQEEHHRLGTIISAYEPDPTDLRATRDEPLR